MGRTKLTSNQIDLNIANESDVVNKETTALINAKLLSERGADFEYKSLQLKTDILSSNAKIAVATSDFIIFDNGDVSEDGKTIIKSNIIRDENETLERVADIFATDDLLFVSVNYYAYWTDHNYIKVFSIIKDNVIENGIVTKERGTLELVRTLSSSDGCPSGFKNNAGKISYEDGIYIFPCRNGGNERGFYYTTNPLTGNMTFNLTGGDDFIKIVKYENKWVGIGGVYLRIATTISGTFSDMYIVYNRGLRNIYVFDTKLVIIAYNELDNVGCRKVFDTLPTEGGYYLNDSAISPILPDILKKINNTYYYINNKLDSQYSGGLYVGQIATAPDLTTQPTILNDANNNPVIGFDINEIGTNNVITLNNTNVLWSGEVKISALNDEVEDVEETNVTISELKSNTIYKYSTIDSLAITSIETSNRKSIIYFTTSASFTTFTYPEGQMFIGSNSIVAEKNYKMEIENGIIEIKEYAIPV